MKTNNDFVNLGEEIKSAVFNAVDAKDFGKLNETITNTLAKTVDMAVTSMTASRSPLAYREKKQEIQLYSKKPEGRVSGPLMAVGGFTAAAFFGLISVASFLVGVATVTGNIVVGGAVTGVFSGAGLLVGGFGMKAWNRVKRFRHYVRCIGNREYMSVKELAARIGSTDDKVARDLEAMIRKGMFLEGRLDDQKTTLMVTPDACRQYEQLRKGQKMQEEERAKLARDPRAAEVIREGKHYIEHIQAANRIIEDRCMSEKLERLELTAIKIFRGVEEHPEQADDLQRFVDYYLPTCKKLIDAYADMTREALETDSIRQSKKEIEATLDTMNEAFENLLDRFFRDRAWDISTDISVMKNMLAQEGLLEPDMKMPPVDSLKF